MPELRSVFCQVSPHIYTYHSHNGRYLDIGNYLDKLAPDIKKYVIVNVCGVLVKDIPMPAQTVMFATNSYTENGQKEKNTGYILPEEISSMECPQSCVVVSLENDALMREEIKKQVPGLTLKIEPGFEILVK